MDPTDVHRPVDVERRDTVTDTYANSDADSDRDSAKSDSETDGDLATCTPQTLVADHPLSCQAQVEP